MYGCSIFTVHAHNKNNKEKPSSMLVDVKEVILIYFIYLFIFITLRILSLRHHILETTDKYRLYIICTRKWFVTAIIQLLLVINFKFFSLLYYNFLCFVGMQEKKKLIKGKRAKI